ncbi:NTF2 fold immunity protein [Arthrobacter sp. NA-172]|uniref:NTF2 fold immunity protein n=1 Tax=Arthrobacter sp. NA-172 TaxID=3367524 RepID=UPI0037551A3F
MLVDVRSKSNGPALRAFVDFVDAMHVWETKSYAAIAPLLENRKVAMNEMAEANRELERIFEKHLIPGSGDRRRMDSNGIGYPPTYDADRDVIKLEKSAVDEVTFRYVQTIRPRARLRFTVRRVADKWRLLDGEIFDARRSKWLKFVI